MNNNNYQTFGARSEITRDRCYIFSRYTTHALIIIYYFDNAVEYCLQTMYIDTYINNYYYQNGK